MTSPVYEIGGLLVRYYVQNEPGRVQDVDEEPDPAFERWSPKISVAFRETMTSRYGVPESVRRAAGLTVDDMEAYNRPIRTPWFTAEEIKLGFDLSTEEGFNARIAADIEDAKRRANTEAGEGLAYSIAAVISGIAAYVFFCISVPAILVCRAIYAAFKRADHPTSNGLVQYEWRL